MARQLAARRLDGAAVDGRPVAGGYLSGAIPGDVLLVVIGAVLVYFGVELLRPRPRPGPAASARDVIDVRAAVLTGAAIGLLGGSSG